MKRKLFCLLTLLLAVCSGAWADPTYKSDFKDWTSDESGSYYTYLTSTNYTSYISAGWMTYTSPSTNSATLTIDPKTDEAITGESKTYGKIKGTSRYMDFYVTGITSIKFYFRNNSGSETRTAYYKLNGGSETSLVEMSKASCGSGSISLDASVNNHIQIYSGSNQEIFACAIKVTPSAAKTYTITLDKNGGTTEGTATATEGSNKLTDITKPTYEGHSVDGYYKEAGLTTLIADAAGNLQKSTDYTDESGNWTATDNKTLYTKWIVKSTYGISYNDNGADSGSVPTDETEYEVGEEVTVRGNTGSLKKSGYTFIGWNTASEGTGTYYASGATFDMGSNDVTLYAVWAANDYSYTSTLNSGDISNGDVIVTSLGGKMTASLGTTATTLKYTAKSISGDSYNVIEFGNKGTGGVLVSLDKKMQVGTVITVNMYNTTTGRGFYLKTASGTSVATLSLGEANVNYSSSYTVTANDGLAGTNSFTLNRYNNCYLISLTVANCANEYVITPVYDMSTYVTPAALDFSGVDGLTAYVATGKGTGTVVMSPVTAVPADTPLLLVGTAGTPYSVPVAAEASAPGTNYLKKGPQTFTGDEEDKYILWTDGKFHLVAAGTLAANKAYLDLAEAGARELSIVFEGEGETTAINAALMNNERMNNEVYNLNGQRVAQPTKGLYIVNGRKVVIK